MAQITSPTLGSYIAALQLEKGWHVGLMKATGQDQDSPGNPQTRKKMRFVIADTIDRESHILELAQAVEDLISDPDFSHHADIELHYHRDRLREIMKKIRPSEPTMKFDHKVT